VTTLPVIIPQARFMVMTAGPGRCWPGSAGGHPARGASRRLRYDGSQMQILAVTNIKGGVGKTTTAVNLAWLAAASGRRTILWDIDPQGAATYILRGEPNQRASARKLVQGKREPSELLAGTDYEYLRLLPADVSYRNFDIYMSDRKHRTKQLMTMSRTLRDACDLLVLDCPPGMSLLSENVLRAADALIVPMLPAPLSLRMIDQLVAYVERSGWPDLRVLPFFSMVDRRRSLHRDVIEAARAQYPEILQTEIPYWSEIERMTVRRAPLPSFAPASPAALVYAALWQETAGHLWNDDDRI
jgi:cellulose biosynthesis protein BcsQ